MHYRKICGVSILASLLAACSQNGVSSIPDAGGYSPVQSSSTQSDPLSPQSQGETGAQPLDGVQPQPSVPTVLPTNNISVQGQVTALQPNGSFSISNATTRAASPVTVTNQTVVNSHESSLANGTWAIAISSKQTPMAPSAAQYVALFNTPPVPTNLSGTVADVTPFGFDVMTDANASVPVMIDANSRVQQPGAVAPGATVNVNGTGSTSVAVLAQSVSVTASATPTATATAAASDAAQPSPQDTTQTTTQSSAVAMTPAESTISTRHLLTGDFLGTAGGSMSLAPSRVAPYVNWVETSFTDANRVSAAGIKTEVYFNPNRISPGDPLYAKIATAGYAHACAGARIYDVFSSIPEYVTSPASSAMHAAYSAYTQERLHGQHIDAIFEDNAGPLTIYSRSIFHPALPCGYSDSAWLSGERSLEAAIPYNTIFNALSGFVDHGLSTSIGLLNSTKTIGGTLEHCYSDNSRIGYGSWAWQAMENTELAVSARGKLFQCMARRTQSAANATAARTYTIASFLLTYNLAHSLLWEQFATPSNFHVLPEAQLVPLSPIVAQPRSVASLLTPSGAYAREYAACYYAGRLIGRCAMVVNSDYAAHSFPKLRYSYEHTMIVHGYSVLDGGTMSTNGPAHASTMAATSAYVLFP